MEKYVFPKTVLSTLKTLEEAGFEAYIVGGSIRDVYLKKEPKDWDITTNARPEEVQKLFSKTVYENTFGTVLVIFEDEPEESVARVIEITTYRKEGKYSDNRHPDEIIFSTQIEDDLLRRDFTINAIAQTSEGQVVDPYDGAADIQKKIIRTVGTPKDRFTEDALRILRAVRFACELGFTIEPETLQALSETAPLLEHISWERKRDEFTKIIQSQDPMFGVGLMQKLGILEYVLPELNEGVGCEQKGEHVYDVFEHLLHALNHAKEKGWPLEIRLAALFHDIGKPKTRRWDGSKAGGKGKYTFYGHEVVGARMTKKILERLRYPKDTIELVVKLVRYHMFFSDTETITLSAVRRTIVNVGREHIWELMQVRECDRVGMKKVEAPYRLRKYHAMIEEALRSPTSVGMLKIDGQKIMEHIREKPGPKIGLILHALLGMALIDPEVNKEEYLYKKVTELASLSIEELKNLAEAGREKKEETEEEELQKLRDKYRVK